ncbi:MAG: hypothetical protein JW702_03775 [Clostridiales bacterium]|nr:hypothetical protein [Clostridiales bacterium]
MNKKIFAISAFLMAFSLLVLPVLATPAEIISVTIVSTPAGGTDPIRCWTTNGDIFQARGKTAIYNFVITIPDEDPITGISENTLNTRINYKIDVATIIYDAAWTTSDGAFVGKIQMKIFDYSQGYTMFTLQVHGTLRGTGAYQGQTLIVTYEGGFIGAVWDGILIRP